MSRYTSATDADRQAMLDAIGVGSVEDLFAEIPEGVRLQRPLDLPAGLAEAEIQGATGADLLVAYLVGVDVECKISEAISPRHYQHGFPGHPKVKCLLP